MLEKNCLPDMSEDELYELLSQLNLPNWFSYMDEDEWDDWMQQQMPPSDPAEWQEWLDSLEPPYDVTEWIRQMDQEEPEKNTITFDPYFKIECTSETQKRSFLHRDETGNLHNWNISAYQIPKISLTEEISGTIYTVTGSFEGTQNLLRKLERITAQKFSEKLGEEA